MFTNTCTSISVIDPCNRTGKITIPMAYVTETKGMTDFDYFQKVKVNVIGLTGSIEATHALSAFARTEALEVALSRAHGVARVMGNRICRLHSQGRCKFGKDCKNIHLCRELTNAVAPKTEVVFTPPPVYVTRRPAPATTFQTPDAKESMCNMSVASSSQKSYGMAESGSVSSRASSVAPEDFSALPVDEARTMPLWGFAPPRYFAADATESKSTRISNSIADGFSLNAESFFHGAASLTDFEEFVDALVDVKLSPVASPTYFLVTPA